MKHYKKSYIKQKRNWEQFALRKKLGFEGKQHQHRTFLREIRGLQTGREYVPFGTAAAGFRVDDLRIMA